MPIKKNVKTRKPAARGKVSRSSSRGARKPTTYKWVYSFREGNKDMRDLLGGKGAGLAEMTRAGLPVPPGFIITTEACNAYSAQGKEFPKGMWEQTLAAMKKVERAAGKKFGDPADLC
jgi:pyruvate,orthophosphate dikinase